jgi:hypothetical protein
MPLRDHFRPPLDDAHLWEELHGQWPAVIVQQLRKKLPPGYEAYFPVNAPYIQGACPSLARRANDASAHADYAGLRNVSRRFV